MTIGLNKVQTATTQASRFRNCNPYTNYRMVDQIDLGANALYRSRTQAEVLNIATFKEELSSHRILYCMFTKLPA
jgi:hypothetical protein